jgi:hypothetical protein
LNQQCYKMQSISKVTLKRDIFKSLYLYNALASLGLDYWESTSSNAVYREKLTNFVNLLGVLTNPGCAVSVWSTFRPNMQLPFFKTSSFQTKIYIKYVLQMINWFFFSKCQFNTFTCNKISLFVIDQITILFGASRLIK